MQLLQATLVALSACTNSTTRPLPAEQNAPMSLQELSFEQRHEGHVAWRATAKTATGSLATAQVTELTLCVINGDETTKPVSQVHARQATLALDDDSAVLFDVNGEASEGMLWRAPKAVWQGRGQRLDICGPVTVKYQHHTLNAASATVSAVDGSFTLKGPIEGRSQPQASY